jgi:hypothetical protein
MGKTADFITKHPLCCNCGGLHAATTRDHVPPRALFNDRVAPEGYEFPACDDCNLGSNLVDQLAALIGRLSVADEVLKNDEFRALLQAIDNNQPDARPTLIESSIEARKILRWLKIAIPPGKTAVQVCDELGLVTIDAHVFQRLDPLFRRLYCALHYMHTGGIVPANSRLMRLCTTNQILAARDPLAWQALPGVQNEVTLVRNGRDLRDQFDYKWGVLEDARFAITFHFRKSIFGAMVGPLTAEMEGQIDPRDVLRL